MNGNTTIAACLLLSACGVAPTDPPARAPQPSAVPDPTTAAGSPPSTSVQTGARATPSPFSVIGELPDGLWLQPAGDRGFVVSQTGIELALVGDEAIHDPLLKRGLPPHNELFTVTGVAGRWPDAAWLATTHPSGRSGFSSLWRWDGRRWKKQQSTGESQFIVAIQPWTDGRLLAVEQAGMMFDASFRLLSGARTALPVFSKAEPQENFCLTALRIEAFTALPDGHVFAAGQRCDAVASTLDPAVERWAPGAKQGTLELLPGTRLPSDPPQAGWRVTGLVALSPADVYVSGEKDLWSEERREHLITAYFAHFDGAKWEVLPNPIPGVIRGLWGQDDGVLFATNADGELWSRAAGGAWSRVPLPEPLESGAKVEAFWPRAPGDAWAIVGTRQNDYLLHTRSAANPLPDLQARAQKEHELRLPGPPVDGCETPFVLLYTLGKKAPADYDYPATRAALKGHLEFVGTAEFIEFGREGRRFFGSRVPDFKVGKKLAALVREKVPGATPELVCHDPIVLRQLAIDLASGELKN